MSKTLTLDGKVKISVNIPQKLLEELDMDRARRAQTRSSWMTSAIMERLSISKKEMKEENK